MQESKVSKVRETTWYKKLRRPSIRRWAEKDRRKLPEEGTVHGLLFGLEPGRPPRMALSRPRALLVATVAALVLLIIPTARTVHRAVVLPREAAFRS